MCGGSAARTDAIGSRRAEPENPCARVRPCTVIMAAPTSTRRRATSAALSWLSSQPARCLTVTGMRDGSTRRTADTSSAASAGSRMSAEPQRPAVTFLAGQPMLMSTIQAPTSAAISAARASASGSRPKICTTKGRPSRLGHIRLTALAAPRVSASAERNSVKVSAAPSSSQTVRNGRSVTASIGASSAPGVSSMSPIRMRARENSIILLALAVAVSAQPSCHHAAPAPPPAAGPEALLADVVDPWSWSRGPASARQRALEDIGPFERARPGDPTAPLVNTNADYWTRLVGLAWDRDVDLDLEGEPVDLDGDGRPDTTVTRHVHARGGVLANPELFGLTRTPDDPRGRVGRVSVSTGVLGLREPLGPDGRPTGQIGMTCWLCHGEANPAGGAVVLGLPGARFDYGLLLATTAVLDDGNAAAAAQRQT